MLCWTWVTGCKPQHIEPQEDRWQTRNHAHWPCWGATQRKLCRSSPPRRTFARMYEEKLFKGIVPGQSWETVAIQWIYVWGRQNEEDYFHVGFSNTVCTKAGEQCKPFRGQCDNIPAISGFHSCTVRCQGKSRCTWLGRLGGRPVAVNFDTAFDFARSQL